MKSPNVQVYEINIIRIVSKCEDGLYFSNNFLLRKGGDFGGVKYVREKFVWGQIIENHILN